MGLGDRILQLIGKQQVTKASFAKGIGVSRTTLDNWIKGDTSPKHQDLINMSNFLNVDISELTSSGVQDGYKDKYLKCMEERIKLTDEINLLKRENEEIKKNVSHIENKPELKT